MVADTAAHAVLAIRWGAQGYRSTDHQDVVGLQVETTSNVAFLRRGETAAQHAQLAHGVVDGKLEVRWTKKKKYVQSVHSTLI